MTASNNSNRTVGTRRPAELPLPHEAVWAAVDAIAERNGLSVYALAMKTGSDKNLFSPCRRVTDCGKPRWPNMQTVAKVLAATGTSFVEFATLVDEATEGRRMTHTTRTAQPWGAAQ